MFEVDADIENVLKKYNEVNNGFEKKVVFHVGDGAGFYSEIDAMMQCMLWCYSKNIKFELFSDDANFSGGNGWNVFFEPFCTEEHNRLHHYGNHRFNIKLRDYKNFFQFHIAAFILKHFYHIDYLTQDIFTTAIMDEQVSRKEIVDCDIFGVYGSNYDEFSKLIKYVVRYNSDTKEAIERKVSSLNLPEHYCSVQIRGGDKTLEYSKLNNLDLIMKRVIDNIGDDKNLFVFTDDYRYIKQISEKYPYINIYTLTREDEKGYINESFQKTEWTSKYENMIKLFSMVEICIRSDIHFGNEYTCVNQYIEGSRKLQGRKYIQVWSRNESR